VAAAPVVAAPMAAALAGCICVQFFTLISKLCIIMQFDVIKKNVFPKQGQLKN
jgi:hypothetical protein